MMVRKIPRKVVAELIRAYQHTLSPDHGPLRVFFPHGFCRFYPTCSEYTRRSVEKLGVIRGLFHGVKRVSRCVPWNPGGVDEVP